MVETVVRDLPASLRGYTADARVLVLGPFRVVRTGVEHTARTRQVGRVGAVLAASPGVPVPRDRLIEILWGDEPPTTAVNTLQVHISQLRAVAGRELIQTTGEGYVLAVEAEAVDAEWFKAEVLECLDAVSNGQPKAIRARLTAALNIWAGDPYGDIKFAEIAGRRNELIELRERARETQLQLSLLMAASPSAFSEVIAAARRQITCQPLREAGYEVLITALRADGRPAEAADAYRKAVDYFQSQIGVQPTDRLLQALEGVN